MIDQEVTMAKAAAKKTETMVPADEPLSGRPVPPENAPPAPHEVADETVKVGRRKLSAYEADRAQRFERRQELHTAYGTTSGRKGDRA